MNNEYSPGIYVLMSHRSDFVYIKMYGLKAILVEQHSKDIDQNFT